jgi:hypothetical protein
MRQKGGGRKPSNPSPNRVYESSGPEGKVRGTPQQIIEKYQSLARDKFTIGDRVMAENCLQHAEHYIRILTAAQAHQARRNEQRDRDDRRDREEQQERNDSREYVEPAINEGPKSAQRNSVASEMEEPVSPASEAVADGMIVLGDDDPDQSEQPQGFEAPPPKSARHAREQSNGTHRPHRAQRDAEAGEESVTVGTPTPRRHTKTIRRQTKAMLASDPGADQPGTPLETVIRDGDGARAAG